MRIESFRRPLWVVGAVIVSAALSVTALYLAKGWERVETPAALADDLSSLQRAKALALLRPVDDAVIWRRMGGRVAAASVRTVVPRADAGLEVMATFYEADQQFCGAVLRDRSRKQALVKVGETIQGWQISRIAVDGVALSQGGAELFVKLPDFQARALAMEMAVPSAAPAVAVTPASQVAAMASVPDNTLPGAVPAPPELTPERPDVSTVSRAQLQLYVKKVGSLMTQGQLVPEQNAAGQIVGLRIVRLDENAVAASRGLKEGDIVREVYSTPLTEPGQIVRLAYQIWTEDPPTVTVVLNRDGKEQQLVYRIQ